MDEVKINYDSLTAIAQDSDTMGFYGFARAGWNEVRDKLFDEVDLAIYDWNQLTNSHLPLRMDGRTMEKIKLSWKDRPIEEYTKPQAREKSKAGVTNVILENYKRKKEGKPIIPLVFLVDSEDPRVGRSCDMDLKGVANGERSKSHRRITQSELNQCYKLCTKASELQDEDFPADVANEIQNVAKETLRFVKLVPDEKDPALSKFESVPPFWEGQEWKNEHEEQRAQTMQEKQRPVKEVSWRNELKSRIIAYIHSLV